MINEGLESSAVEIFGLDWWAEAGRVR